MTNCRHFTKGVIKKKCTATRTLWTAYGADLSYYTKYIHTLHVYVCIIPKWNSGFDILFFVTFARYHIRFEMSAYVCLCHIAVCVRFWILEYVCTISTIVFVAFTWSLGASGRQPFVLTFIKSWRIVLPASFCVILIRNMLLNLCVCVSNFKYRFGRFGNLRDFGVLGRENVLTK